MKRKTREEIEKRLEELETENRKLKFDVKGLWLAFTVSSCWAFIAFVLALKTQF